MSFRVKRPLPLAILGLAGLAAAASVAQDTAMFRGNTSLTGYSPENIETPLALEWKFTSVYFGHNPSSPAVADGTVYFASGNRVYAIDVQTGAQKWQYPQDQPLTTSIHASPVVWNNTVYVAAGDGKVYSIDAKTGKPGWLFNTGSSIASTPTLLDGVLYFGSADSRMWAVDAKTGNMVPAWKGGVRLLDEVATAPAIGNGLIYAISSDQALTAIQAATGKPRWKYNLQGQVQGMSPVLAGDTVFVGNGPNLTALTARSLLLKWQRIFAGDVTVPPAVTDRGLVVVTNDNLVRLVEPRNGKDRWKAPVALEYDVLAPPTVAGNTVIVGTTLGGINAIDLDTGQLKWTYTIRPNSKSDQIVAKNTNVAAAPVVANKTLFVLTDDGTLNAFRADSLDASGPEIEPSEPEQGIVMNGAPPIRFEATIVDEGSGIKNDSVKLLLDKQAILRKPSGDEHFDKPGFTFDPVSSQLKYQTIEPSSAGAVRPLADGRHEVTVVASDWKGNTATKTWSFTVDNTLAKVVQRRPNPRNQGDLGPGGGPPGSGGRSSGPGGRGGRGSPGGSPGGGPGGRGGRGGGEP